MPIRVEHVEIPFAPRRASCGRGGSNRRAHCDRPGRLGYSRCNACRIRSDSSRTCPWPTTILPIA